MWLGGGNWDGGIGAGAVLSTFYVLMNLCPRDGWPPTGNGRLYVQIFFFTPALALSVRAGQIKTRHFVCSKFSAMNPSLRNFYNMMNTDNKPKRRHKAKL